MEVETNSLLVDGSYLGRGVDWSLGETSTGKNQVAILIHLIEPNRHMAWYGFFTDETIDSTHKALRALGWTGESYDDLTGIDQLEVSCVVGTEDDQEGKPRNRIRWINKPLTAGMLMKKQLTDNERKLFGLKMKGKLMALDRKLSTTPGTAPSSGRSDRDEIPPPGDDDVPPFMRGR